MVKKYCQGLLPISLERTLKNFWKPNSVNRNEKNPAFELVWGVFGTKGCRSKILFSERNGFWATAGQAAKTEFFPELLEKR
jgi:hypothetical protein